MEQIRPHIWLGSAHNLHSPAEMKRKGITGVLNVADDRPPDKNDTWNFTVIYVPLKDNTKSNPHWLLDHAVNSLQLLLDHHTIFVHCREGINRSPTVLAMYLSRAEGTSFAQAWADIREIRPKVLVSSRTMPDDFR